jgi:hypothetical protein
MLQSNHFKTKLTGIAVISGILFFDFLVYMHHREPGRLFPVCYPSGKIEYDTLLNIPNSKITRQKNTSRTE